MAPLFEEQIKAMIWSDDNLWLEYEEINFLRKTYSITNAKIIIKPLEKQPSSSSVVIPILLRNQKTDDADDIFFIKTA